MATQQKKMHLFTGRLLFPSFVGQRENMIFKQDAEQNVAHNSVSNTLLSEPELEYCLSTLLKGLFLLQLPSFKIILTGGILCTGGLTLLKLSILFFINVVIY